MPVDSTCLPLAKLPSTIAQQRGSDMALACEDETCSWDELNDRSTLAAKALVSRGVKPDDMVTIALPNCIDFVVACFAVWKAGATPQLTSARLPMVELDAIIDLAKSSAVIANSDLKTKHETVSVDTLVSSADKGVALPDHVAASWKAPTSGGSTGRPKLIVSSTEARCDEESSAAWRIEPDSIALMPGPLYHNGPFVTTIYALTVGAQVVIMPRFDPEQVLARAEQYSADWLYMVPTMMNRIWKLGDEIRAKYDVSTLNTVWHLAAPCPAWLKESWINWLGGDVIWELYAATEGMAGTVITGTEWMEHRGSVGRVFSGEIRVLDDDGNELPPNETGELFMRAPDPDKDTFRYVGADAEKKGGWQSLGDMGHFDEDGFLYLADRRSDMIIVGGSNVYPAEIEAALEEHDAVESAAIIGLPDDDLGALVHAIVHLQSAVEEEDLRAFLNDRLVRYKCPRTYEFVDEPLRDIAGKVRRSQLRADRIQEK